MLRVLLFALLVIFAARSLSRLFSGIVDGLAGRDRQLDQSVHMVRDPVCGTFVVPSQELMVVRGRRVLFFCSERCRAAYTSALKGNA